MQAATKNWQTPKIFTFLKTKTLIKGLLISIFTFGISSQSHAMPAQIVIFRHAEKINDRDPGLSKRGEERAQKIPELFESNETLKKYGAPVAIYAMEPESKNHSQRSILTVQPLAKKYGLPVLIEARRDQVKKLVKKIRREKSYDGKTVVICWQHEKIDDIVNALGSTDHPKAWGDIYDRLWVLDFTGAKVGFRDLPMKLLPGDQSK